MENSENTFGVTHDLRDEDNEWVRFLNKTGVPTPKPFLEGREKMKYPKITSRQRKGITNG